MTSPAPVGFPDWQRTFSAARNVLYNVGPRAIVANDVSPVIPTVNMKAILLDLQASVNNVRLVVAWFIDKAATVMLSQDLIDVKSTAFFEQTITVKGPFVQFTAEPQPAGSCTYFLLVSEAADNSISQVDVGDSIIIATELVSIPGGGNRTDRAMRVMAAPVSFFVFSPAAAVWEAVLFLDFADGGTLDFGYISNKTTPLPQSLYLPCVPVGITTTNHDAGAQNFYITITAKPLYP